jgi:hypothetical protein
MTATTDKLEANKKLARDYIDQVFNQHNPGEATDFVSGECRSSQARQVHGCGHQVVTLGFHEPPLRMFPCTGRTRRPVGTARSSSTSPAPARSRLRCCPRSPGPTGPATR